MTRIEVLRSMIEDADALAEYLSYTYSRGNCDDCCLKNYCDSIDDLMLHCDIIWRKWLSEEVGK